MINELYDVTHVDTSDHRSMDNLSKLDFTNVSIAMKSIFGLRKVLKQTNPDIVYIPVASNFLPYLRDGLLIATAASYSNARIIVHLHEGNYFREGFYAHSNYAVKKFIEKTLRKVHTAIVLSPRFKNVFYGFVENIRVCPNGIADEFTAFNTQIERENDRKIVVSYLGNMFESKGVLDTLNAAACILRNGGVHNIEFQYTGAWSEADTKREAEKIISENNMQSKIKFNGVLTGADKTKFLKTSDILVFPSRYRHEGFPLVILEAMSAGIPVISTKNTGAIPDIVIDGETGFLIEESDVKGIANAILKLASDDSLRKSMSEKSRKRFVENYQLEKNISGMIEIFNEALSS